MGGLLLSKRIFVLIMSLPVFLLQQRTKELTYHHHAIVRGDTRQRQLALVFTGDAYADGGEVIFRTLKQKKIKASFFLTGDFYRNTSFQPIIGTLREAGHYLGAHSDKHLLYCRWENRDSLLVTKEEFRNDLLANYAEMKKHGVHASDALYFLPPYEWYNDSIALWTNELGFKLINFSPGTLSHADYTTPAMTNYRSSDVIFESITSFEKNSTHGLNGFILLLHVGTDPRRTDKFYDRLRELIDHLQKRRYEFVRIDALLDE
jgi:peptidoglycan/xylan/chitin deacetylase (PgdA/CDA1 family)